ncbi:AAA family ATPase [Glutamicibacter sp. X7]
MNSQQTIPLRDTSFREQAEAITNSMRRVLSGKDEVTEQALIVLLAEGHLLVEDVPGVGKTMLAKALARSVDCSVHRIQFTPDLLPSDVTGVSVFSPKTQEFSFHPGPIFANIIIADEINRANAKTQSALLESMEEHQVTVDSVTHDLQRPFMVVATQNPIDSEGTFALPEAQRDRFMARISMGYPQRGDEIAMIANRHLHEPVDDVSPVIDREQLRTMIHQVANVTVTEQLGAYVVDLGRGTREHPSVRLGASPRALLQLVRAAKAHAALRGRDYAIPEDVRAVGALVLPHRLILTRNAVADGQEPQQIVTALLQNTDVNQG